MNDYLPKHAFTGQLVEQTPAHDLAMVVVIPVHEEESLLDVLADLSDCDETENSVEIIVVINHSEDADAEAIRINQKTYHDAGEWTKLDNRAERSFHILYQPDLPKKKAVVGLARKIGMDEAVRRFEQIQNPNGIIVCLDADCRVQKNYLGEIERFFAVHPEREGCSIHFEHSLDGLDDDHWKAIIDYELHLRYFIGMQRWAGYPFAYQTVGSAMAVRVDVYCKVGGMNMRQAGEDFYFLHKVIERGAFAELNTTTVMPSARISERVPFGTGRAMLNQLQKKEQLLTYHPRIFQDLRIFLRLIPLFHVTGALNTEYLLVHCVPVSIRTFLQSVDFTNKLEEIKSHTASPAAFQKRLFRWFNAFMLMKCVHFVRDNFYTSIPVNAATQEFASLMQFNPESVRSSEELLVQLRLLDRTANDRLSS